MISGINGLLLYIMALAWWGINAKLDKEWKDWEDAVAEMHWSFTSALTSMTTA